MTNVNDYSEEVYLPVVIKECENFNKIGPSNFFPLIKVKYLKTYTRYADYRIFRTIRRTGL